MARVRQRRILTCACALVTATLAAGASPAGAQTVRVEWERAMVPASSSSAARPITELFAVVNPVNAKHWVAVGMQPGPESMLGGRCIVFTTLDGGGSWQERPVELAGHCGDPWLAFASPSTVLLSALANMGELKVLRSGDGGRSWSDSGASLGRGHDHPVLVSRIDSTGRPNGAWVVSSQGRRDQGIMRYVAFVGAIDSSGNVVGIPTVLRPSGLASNTLKSAVLADGTLLAPFIDNPMNMAPAPPAAGAPVASTPVAGTPPPVLERRRVWLYRSSDSTRSFTPPLVVTDQCGSARGFAELAADQSRGPFRDRLYFACFRHDGAAALIARSEDRGERWTMAVAFDAASSQPPRLARTLSTTVGPEGIVGLVWYDRRDDPKNECQHLYFSASRDGGVSFAAPTRLSSMPSCPGAVGNRNGWTATRWQGGGDYSGLAALPDGRFLVVWADSRSGVYQPYSALVRVTP